MHAKYHMFINKASCQSFLPCNAGLDKKRTRKANRNTPIRVMTSGNNSIGPLTCLSNVAHIKSIENTNTKHIQKQHHSECCWPEYQWYSERFVICSWSWPKTNITCIFRREKCSDEFIASCGVLLPKGKWRHPDEHRNYLYKNDPCTSYIHKLNIVVGQFQGICSEKKAAVPKALPSLSEVSTCLDWYKLTMADPSCLLTILYNWGLHHTDKQCKNGASDETNSRTAV